MTRPERPNGRPRPGVQIFRHQAIEHHRTGQDAVRLPHYATLSVRVAMWSLIALVLAGAGVALAVSVPRDVVGTARVVSTAHGPSISVLVPPDEFRTLHPGDPVTIVFDRSPEPVVTHIVAAPAVAAPAPAGSRRRTRNTGGTRCSSGAAAPAPATATASPGVPPAAVAADAAPTAVEAALPASGPPVPVEGVGQATVEIGRQPLISWIAP